MSKAHEWAEEIKAWADGKEIQWQTDSGEWVDFDVTEYCGPWDPHMNFKWRVKPEFKKGWVRVAEHKDNTGSLWTATWADYEDKSEEEIKDRPDFIRWLSPRFDFDYPEDYEGGK